MSNKCPFSVDSFFFANFSRLYFLLYCVLYHHCLIWHPSLSNFEPDSLFFALLFGRIHPFSDVVHAETPIFVIGLDPKSKGASLLRRHCNEVDCFRFSLGFLGVWVDSSTRLCDIACFRRDDGWLFVQIAFLFHRPLQLPHTFPLSFLSVVSPTKVAVKWTIMTIIFHQKLDPTISLTKVR